MNTPSDFGFQSDPPTHGDLLDYLAWRFMESGWSIKSLHRLILLSSTFRQSAAGHPGHQKACRQLDPENTLLWRANRRRLDFEAMRDSLLFVSCGLDTSRGGRSVEITTRPFSRRRTIYGFIDRQNLQEVFRTFDLASPDTTNARRHTTTVPQQALFMMNSPFVTEMARHLVARRECADLKDQAEQVRCLHRRVYGREATADEIELGLRYLYSQKKKQEKPGSAMSAMEKYAQVLLLANEFVFLD